MRTFLSLLGIFFSIPLVAQELQEIPLHSLDETSGLKMSSWRIQNLSSITVEASDPRFGGKGILFLGDAERDSAKGDIGLRGDLPEGLKAVSLSISSPSEANVRRAGIQVQDAEGEYLVHAVPVDWFEWKRIDVDLENDAFDQAYRQDDKNGQVDLPIRSINFVWYTDAAGPTAVGIDGLVGLVEGIPTSDRPQLHISAVPAVDEGERAGASVQITNYSEEPMELVLDYEIQRNPDYYDVPPPHPELGRDEAREKLSWTERQGERVSEGTLTDGQRNSSYGFPWGSNIEEADQIIDLGESMPVTHLVKYAGDANWVFKVDILRSDEGVNYEPVPGWQNLDWNGQWGRSVLAAEAPFDTQYLKFKYHNNGEPMQTLRMPVEIGVFNGIGDETLVFPVVGETVETGTVSVQVPSRSFAVVPFESNEPLGRGAYLISARYAGESPEANWISWNPLLVLPPPLEKLSPESPFGINGSAAWLADWNQKLSVGWVRFENLKWPMVSPEPGKFAFDGSVGPWHMNVDEYVETYVNKGISVLPYLFQVPVFASSAPEGVTKNIKQYPPKDYEGYGEFVFQTVARYGSVEHPDKDLLTEDKVSGLGWMNTYELWNEPNLDDPSWGHWIGTMEEYFEMFRIGAEAAKEADPSVIITNAGLAGTDLGLVDQFRSYQYEDGKSPLDFIDVINVHHYTQPDAPEIATVNSNIDRSGNREGSQTFEMNLLQLDDWRDRFRPEAEIWLTETGFDTAGPRQVSVRTQAAYTPRNVLMILGSGIDKVMVFREMGSNPSLYAACGMLDEDGNPRGSFLTYATLIRVMDGAQGFIRLPHPNPNVRLYGAIKDQRPIIAAWAVAGEETLDLDFGPTTMTDAFGHSMEAEVGPDHRLTIFPSYFEGMDLELPRKLFSAAQRLKDDRSAALERERELRVKLYDFGEAGVGALTVGDIRSFLPVKADTIYNPDQGYGFLEAHDLRANIDRQWIRDPLSRDGVKIVRGNTFRFEAEPGVYNLSFMAAPLGGNPATVEVVGIQGGPERWSVTRDDDIVRNATVTIGNSPIDIVFPEDYGVLFWISLIEQP